jgi:hypothetical protein
VPPADLGPSRLDACLIAELWRQVGLWEELRSLVGDPAAISEWRHGVEEPHHRIDELG